MAYIKMQVYTILKKSLSKNLNKIYFKKHTKKNIKYETFNSCADLVEGKGGGSAPPPSEK